MAEYVIVDTVYDFIDSCGSWIWNGAPNGRFWKSSGKVSKSGIGLTNDLSANNSISPISQYGASFSAIGSILGRRSVAYFIGWLLHILSMLNLTGQILLPPGDCCSFDVREYCFNYLCEIHCFWFLYFPLFPEVGADYWMECCALDCCHVRGIYTNNLIYHIRSIPRLILIPWFVPLILFRYMLFECLLEVLNHNSCY